MGHGCAADCCWAGSPEWVGGPDFVVRGRAARSACRGRQRAGVRGDLRALSPVALSLLPLDCARGRRRAGRVAVGVRERVCGAEAWAARRAVASVVVSDRAQRGGLVDSSTPQRCGARRRCRAVGWLGGRPRRRAGTIGVVGRGSARVVRSAAGCVGDARAQWALARGDRDRARDVGRRGKADDLRGAARADGVRGGSLDDV